MTDSDIPLVLANVDVADFRAVEAIEAASSAAGWALEYRQLEAGGLSATVTIHELQGPVLSQEVVNRRLEVVGETPPDEVTIHSIVHGGMIVNGFEVTAGSVVVLPPSRELFLLTLGPVHAVTLQIAEDDFAAHLDATATGRQSVGQSGQAVEVAPGWASRAASLIHAPPGEEAANLVAEVAEAMQARQDLAAVDARVSGAALDRARGYIEAFLPERIRMEELARHAGVSLRTLERLFRRSFQATPSAYIQTRRLEKVRRDLLDPRLEHEPISMVAMAHGFSHLGRFAASYRAQYGEKPSESRRRRKRASASFNAAS